MTHARAKLTVAGRLLLVERVLELGWTVTMAAEAQGCSAATGYKWLRRFRAEGHGGLQDRSSRPLRSPTRLSHAREQAIFGDFGTDGVGAVGPRGPAVGDVEEEDSALELARERADVLEDGAIGGGGVEGDEDFLPHGVVLRREISSIAL